jgi:hypothetical protein
MSEQNTGGPAYPTNNWEKMVPQSTGYHEGMTLRDYFAAQAMQGLLAGTQTSDAGMIVRDSYRVADAMMKAREQ